MVENRFFQRGAWSQTEHVVCEVAHTGLCADHAAQNIEFATVGIVLALARCDPYSGGGGVNHYGTQSYTGRSALQDELRL